MRIRTIEPTEVRLSGVTVLPRALRLDPRGFLVETMRRDDRTVDGEHFAMSYTSVTVPGQMRDADRWHVHQRQIDRFVVPLGEMILALFDPRPHSPTQGEVAAIRMEGASVAEPRSKASAGSRTTYLVTIPIGVYHCIGNLHGTEPFVLQNYPTQLYDPTDEGRVPFPSVPIASLGGSGFAWDLVDVIRPGRTSA
jgi:dTDP-4-dehydrorhamnose 3,5-epimerase